MTVLVTVLNTTVAVVNLSNKQR